MTDSAVADHAASDRSTRRTLLGAGAIGAVLALAGTPSASAGSTGLSDDDLALARFAISLELAARDLWDVTLAAGAQHEIYPVIRENHEAYAQILAGITGISANQPNTVVFDSLAAGFSTATPSIVGYDLESIAAATHIDLLAKVTDVEIARAIASIAAVEARHAAVIAWLRDDDFDAQFANAAAPISPDAAS